MFPTIVEQARNESIQSRGKDGFYSGIPLLLSLASGSGLLPPWWSPTRDQALRQFWKRSDHLSGAMYNMIAKMTAIPFSAVPRDYTDLELVEEAENETQRILDGAEFGEGWNTFYSKILEDMLGQDNGWFAEVIGGGSSVGPIQGQAITVAHLDAARCQRTGDPEFPVLYYDTRGKLYKIHYTRVMFNSQMPSAIEEMYGVGFCSVSRATMTAQNLIDIAVYKMEKLGSRPHRELLITRGGLDPEDMRSAFAMANEMNDNQGLSRYSKIVVAGNSAMPDADVKQVTFTNLPDGFDEKTALTLGMATLAMAFGVDARDLFPGLEAGATRADALLAHLKQRGKGPGQIISDIEAQFNRKFLPGSMKMVFDFQDDAEDMQVAEIKHVRAQRRERDIAMGSIDTHTVREQMIADGDLTHQQFQMLELKDGRMEDGTPVIALFHSHDKIYRKFLTLEDVDNPLDVTSNDPSYILMKADEAIMNVNAELLNAKNFEQRIIFQRAGAALEALKRLYQESLPVKPQEGENEAPRNYPTRRENLLYPNPRVELSTQVSTLPNKDDKMKALTNFASVADDPSGAIHRYIGELNAMARHLSDRLKEIHSSIDLLNQMAEAYDQTAIIKAKETQEPPIVNVTVPMPELRPQINLPELNPTFQINVPPQEITIKQPIPKQTREQQVVQRDAAGNMIGTRSVTEYDYGE